MTGALSSGGNATTKYPTPTGEKCIWCHTSQTCSGSKACVCEKACEEKHCLLGPNKGAYPTSSGTGSWTKYKSGSSSSSNGNTSQGSYGYGTTTSYECDKKSHPDVLFIWNGIKFAGHKKWTLEARIGKANDPKRLIVNCSNSSFSPKHSPGKQTIPQLINKCSDPLRELENPALLWQPPEVFPYYTHELSLSWSDGKGILADLQWWKKFLEIATTEAYAEIDVCCIGGHGRTGTFLGIIMMLTHKWNKSPSVEAESWINKHYCKKAIETKDQQEYMDWIAARMMEPEGEQEA